VLATLALFRSHQLAISKQEQWLASVKIKIVCSMRPLLL